MLTKYPTKYPTSAASIPITKILNPSLNWFSFVNFPFIVPVINKANAAKTSAIVIEELTLKKKNGIKGIKLPIMALNPTT